MSRLPYEERSQMRSRWPDFPMLRATRLLVGRAEPPTPVDYASGDDILRVDWSRCARHDELVLRRAVWAPRPVLRLLIDCSRSMGVGEPAKLSFATKLAAELARAASSNGTNVGAAGFAQDFWHEISPARSIHQGERVREWLKSLTPQGANLSASDAIARLVGKPQIRVQQPLAGELILLLGDFLDPREAAAFSELILQLGGEPGFIQILDHTELAPDQRGRLELTDSETGRRLRVRLRATDLANYHAVMMGRLENLASYSRRRGLLCVAIRTSKGIEQALDAIFRANAGTKRASVTVD